jgi:ribose transport system ATP-binding protein
VLEKGTMTISSVVHTIPPPPPSTGPALLEMHGINKRFPGVQALDNVDFKAHAHEVHALMGENGAGKSTLMKILTGVYSSDGGQILLDGKLTHASDPRAAQRHGIAIIHQELNQVPELSVAENFFLGREKRSPLGLLDTEFMRAETTRWLERLGLQLNVDRPLRGLRVAERQLLEIAKAISLRARILVMDEPTTALNTEEVTRLFGIVRQLRDDGLAIIYISHRMDEIFNISDRVTVLRDGQLAGSHLTTELTRDTLIALMVGRALPDLYAANTPHDTTDDNPEVLRVTNLEVRAKPGSQPLQNINFTVRAGEVVGLAGLLGAGRTELLEALYGVPHPSSVQGEIRVAGEAVRITSPRDAIRAGMGFVTEDRKHQSLVLVRSVAENISLAGLTQFVRLGLIRPKLEEAAIEQSIRTLRVKTPSSSTIIASLSGGNQQKVVFAKYWLTKPRLFLLDEPTQGIDVGAKAEIYALIRDLAKAGTSVILASSEMPELLQLCDRILVLCDGRITADLPRAEATQEKILDYATRFRAPTEVRA